VLRDLPVTVRLDVLASRLTSRRVYARGKRRTCALCDKRRPRSEFTPRGRVCAGCVERTGR
jgi:hypothetical protein